MHISNLNVCQTPDLSLLSWYSFWQATFCFIRLCHVTLQSCAREQELEEHSGCALLVEMNTQGKEKGFWQQPEFQNNKNKVEYLYLYPQVIFFPLYIYIHLDISNYKKSLKMQPHRLENRRRNLYGKDKRYFWESTSSLSHPPGLQSKSRLFYSSFWMRCHNIPWKMMPACRKSPTKMKTETTLTLLMNSLHLFCLGLLLQRFGALLFFNDSLLQKEALNKSTLYNYLSKSIKAKDHFWFGLWNSGDVRVSKGCRVMKIPELNSAMNSLKKMSFPKGL